MQAISPAALNVPWGHCSGGDSTKHAYPAGHVQFSKCVLPWKENGAQNMHGVHAADLGPEYLPIGQGKHTLTSGGLYCPAPQTICACVASGK